MTTRGIPQLYYGTEILMTNPGTTDHGIIRSDFPGGWEGDEVDPTTGKGLTKQQLKGQSFLRKLMQWRNQTPAIHSGKLKHFAPVDGVYVYFRYDENGLYMIILNKNKAPYDLDLNRFGELLEDSSKGTDVLNNSVFDFSIGRISLPTHLPLILKIE
jgi:glycosidase